MTAREEQAKDAAQTTTGATGAQEAGAVRALKSTTPNAYEELAVDELAARVAACKERGFRFIQMCATTTDEGVELLYSFSAPDPRVRDITAFILQVKDGAHVPSISGDYPEAFVNENEAHDLFSVCFDGLALDYEGKFYTMPVSYPMNPRAQQAAAAGAGTDGADATAPATADAPTDASASREEATR